MNRAGRALALALVFLSSSAFAGDASEARAYYGRRLAPRLVPMLCELVRFPTVAGNAKGATDQQAWLRRFAKDLGFAARNAGTILEVDWTGPPGAPVLGLVIHGDVQPVEEERWSVPPFSGVERDGFVWGRGSADDKGPLVQALLAMRALKDTGARPTHTIRLLVGSDEESGGNDVTAYLKAHEAPAMSLVLDSVFPVVVGEKAWNAPTVTTAAGWGADRSGTAPFEATALEAGLATSIVPDRAELRLRWRSGRADWEPLAASLRGQPLPGGTRLAVEAAGTELRVVATGRSAHGGMNLEGGRNALVALARAASAALPPSGARDLLEFARMAGEDLHGGGLGLGERHPLWGAYDVNVATIKPVGGGGLRLTINVRRVPPLSGAQLKQRFEGLVGAFNARTGARLEAGGYYEDEPLAFDPESKLVKRLLAAYSRATGEVTPPAISGGGTYAKRIPNAIAFGMWFPHKPYPGHDVDERIPVADLHRGTHVLIEALADLACSPPLVQPFAP